ncbi:uncharacterized protein LOC108864402 [Galendromus occidentalis]|uniref:Uncharacterized protein LOC108864402 n=1 Tax=Galendromus occidentalis TaxID=34638 RepID=A0AAJ7L6F7_9ACAR|nr:uncharacterized protein LOC108864402 [Galendromus occidentalis]
MQSQSPEDPSRDHAPSAPSPQKLGALRECGREAFIYRSAPLMVSSVLAVAWALKTKRISIEQGTPKLPIYLATAAAAFVIGKFSYRMNCAHKLIALSEELEIERHKTSQPASPDETLEWGAGRIHAEKGLEGEDPQQNRRRQEFAQPSLSNAADKSTDEMMTSTNRYGDNWIR